MFLILINIFILAYVHLIRLTDCCVGRGSKIKNWTK
jgi:hypothetical protein